jgi:replication-associated recombination protein RarA
MYQALYRKYRPKNFEDVVGQKVIIKTLSNSVVNDKEIFEKFKTSIKNYKERFKITDIE